MPSRVIGPSHHGQMLNSVSSITNDSPSEETPSVWPPPSHLATFSPVSLGASRSWLPEQVTSRVSARNRVKFPHHHALRPPVHDRGELEMVASQHHDIEIGGDLQHPIEL